MKIYLCRHGQTKENKENVIQGHKPTKLNTKGQKQAEKLAKHLKQKQIDKLYSSPMKRAQETAQKIKKEKGLEIKTKENLKEISRGKYEGEPFEKLIKAVTQSETPDHLWKPENGETLEELKKRVTKTIKQIAKENNEEDKIAVIAHGGANTTILMGILDHSAKNAFKIKQENCCINELTWKTQKGFQISKVNQTKHLTD